MNCFTVRMEWVKFNEAKTLLEGYKAKTDEIGEKVPDEQFLKYGFRYFNYIADIFDYVEKYKIVVADREQEVEQERSFEK